MKNRNHMENFEEIRIDVPWGYLAGKWYGPKNVRPIVALHGWLDNVDSFATLIPYLPQTIGILCIDLPGHGRSSWLPNGIYYHSIDYIQVILLIMKAYNWKTISILGHSLCSMLGFVFAGLYPDKIDLLIGIDLLKPMALPPVVALENIRRKFDGFLKADERNQKMEESLLYTYSDAKAKLFQGSNNSIDWDKLHYILDRNISKSTKYPSMYYFSYDGRLKYYDRFDVPNEISLELAKKIKVPFLSIKGSKSTFFHEDYYNEILNELKKNEHFENCIIDGTHHLHLNNPKETGAIISQFILKHRQPQNEIKNKL